MRTYVRSSFRLGDMKRAMKAVQDMGVSIYRVAVDKHGRIEITSEEAEAKRRTKQTTRAREEAPAS